MHPGPGFGRWREWKGANQQERMRMKLYGKFLATAAFAAGIGLAATAPASAYIACNHEGDCWHTDSRVRAPGVTFDFHPDDWYFHQTWGTDRHFRDYHPGRGYWRGGVWVTL
jgi:hypothetical protein